MFSNRATCRPRDRARKRASALSFPPDHMSAYRSAEPDIHRDGAVEHLLHAQAREAAAFGAVVRAEMGACAVQAQHEPGAHLTAGVVAWVDRMPAVSHRWTTPRSRARARTRSRDAP